MLNTFIKYPKTNIIKIIVANIFCSFLSFFKRNLKSEKRAALPN